MSKWKDDDVSIVQIIPSMKNRGYNDEQYFAVDGTVGLGSDSKLYSWDNSVGKWRKEWNYDEE